MSNIPDPETVSSPVCPDSFDKFFMGNDVCSVLRQAMLTNDKLKSFFQWMMDPDEGNSCKLSRDFAFQLVSLSNPIGTTTWSPVDIDLDKDEWVMCDGTTRLKTGKWRALYKVIGDQFNPEDFDEEDRFTLPNLKGRVLLGWGQRDYNPDELALEEEDRPTLEQSREAGLKGGEDKVAMTGPEAIGEHVHGMGGINRFQDPPVSHSDADKASAHIRFKEQDEDHPNNAVVTTYKVKPYMALSGYPLGGDSTKVGSYDEYNSTQVLTTEPILDLLKDELEDDETLEPFKTTPHNNLPPYMTGIHYMRANYKVNGVLMYQDGEDEETP